MTQTHDRFNPAESRVGPRPRISLPSQSLMFRVSIVVTLALLPLGILAVWQTDRAFDAAVETYRASIEARTAAIARPEREALIDAMGQVESLANTIAILSPGPAACADLMRRAARSSDRVRFVGFVDRQGRSDCNNLGNDFKFDDTPKSLAMRASPQRHVAFNPSGGATDAPVIIVSDPVLTKGAEFLGYVSLSFSSWAHDLTSDLQGTGDAVVVTFNDDGELLSTSRARDQATELLPADIQTADLVGARQQVFRGPARNGAMREFVLVPIISGHAYALGSWTPNAPFQRGSGLVTLTLAFPMLMWLITLLVLFGAMQQQVIVPLRSLGRKMRSFSDGRRLFHTDDLQRAPTEIYEIGDTFERVAQKVAEDEASLEARLFERDVLLKEVHHRVKNNLQLMSSIMNMQTRHAQNPDVRAALRSVQNRVSSLATVYRNLYQSAEVSHVRVDRLIEGLLSQLIALGAAEDAGNAQLDMRLEKLTLLPDQAGPLAMLAAEGFTSALALADAPGDNSIRIRIDLTLDHDEAGETVIFRLCTDDPPNLGSDTGPDDPARQLGGGGIDDQLIASFVTQLGGTHSEIRTPGRYVLDVRFAVQDFDPPNGPEAPPPGKEP